MEKEIIDIPLSKVTVLPYDKKVFDNRPKPVPIRNYNVNIKRNTYDNRSYRTINNISRPVIPAINNEEGLVSGMINALVGFFLLIIKALGLLVTLGLFERRKSEGLFDFLSKKKREIKKRKYYSKKFDEF